MKKFITRLINSRCSTHCNSRLYLTDTDYLLKAVQTHYICQRVHNSLSIEDYKEFDNVVIE